MKAILWLCIDDIFYVPYIIKPIYGVVSAELSLICKLLNGIFKAIFDDKLVIWKKYEIECFTSSQFYTTIIDFLKHQKYKYYFANTQTALNLL